MQPATNLEALIAELGDVEGRRILDIGCGEGALDRALAERGAEVTGVDPLMPTQEWESVGRGRWRILSTGAEDLPLPDGSVDAAIFVFSLHHIPMAVLPAVLKEAHRVLMPGGPLYVAEPVAAGDFNSVVSLFHDESEVRAEAQRVLMGTAEPLFASRRTGAYLVRRQFADFDAFARAMTANMRFNSYTAEAIVAAPVRAQFAAVAARTGGMFDQPVKVDLFR
jgi:ubiquinone/menaquinone biosynthesis C-methylase UbiE